MNKNDEMLARALREAQIDGSAPPFAGLFRAAEQRIRLKRRMQFTAAGAAAVIALVAVNLQPVDQPDDFIYVDREELAASTSWSAPSDSLLPTREIDIYQEIPRLFESTEPDGGALL